jgi:phosphoglycolate phosphatase
MFVPRLLVFDLDGTLIDSSVDLCNSVNATLENAGKPTLPHALIATYIGDGAAMLVRRALGDPGDLDSRTPIPDRGDSPFNRAFNFFLDYYRIHKLDNTYVYPGVLEALTTIRAAYPSLPMAVLTNKPVIPSREICAALGLAPFFFQNYGGNSFPKKPDPEGLLTLIAEASALFATGVTPAQTLMFGDSDVDVLTARRAGAVSVGCTYGLAPHTLAAAAPDLSVDAPSEWPRILGLE